MTEKELDNKTCKGMGLTPKAFVELRIVELIKADIDELRAEEIKLTSRGKSFLNALIKKNHELVEGWSKYGDCSAERIEYKF